VLLGSYALRRSSVHGVHGRLSSYGSVSTIAMTVANWFWLSISGCPRARAMFKSSQSAVIDLMPPHPHRRRG